MGDKGGIALSIGASVCVVIVVVTAIALYFTGIIKLPDLSVALGGKAEYFVDNVFNYPTLAEAYKVATLNGLNKLNHV